MVWGTAIDGVEIGDVEYWEWVERAQSASNIHRVGAFRERRDDRPIAGAITASGAHHLAAFQVENGDDTHRLSHTLSVTVMRA